MGTSLDEVMEILDMFKSNSKVFTDAKIPLSYCKYGVIQASIILSKDFPMTSTTVDNGSGVMQTVVTIDTPITDKELYLAGLFAYRNYSVNNHDDVTGKAINFKTISFAVSGLTERAKEMMRIVYWCEKEIARTLTSLGVPMGIATEMVGADYVSEL